jgi:hypothetical protein
VATYELKPFKGEVMRITKLDACGNPVTGPKSQLVTDGFVSVEGTAEVEDGQEYKLKGANDKFIYNTRGKPRIKWWNLNINLARVSPDAYNMTTGAPLEMNDAATPEAVGYRIDEDMDAMFAMELWTSLEGLPCINGVQSYGYMLLPWVRDAIPGDWTVANDVISFPLKSARTEKAAGWGVGPYNVINRISGTPGPSPLLVPVGAKQHQIMMLTTLAPPAVTAGAVSLP